jgi:hypothetical protein
MTDKPILLVTFDGVIHSFKSGWQGIGVIGDPPTEGAFEFLARALEHFDVNVWSERRSRSESGRWAMFRWFGRHGWPIVRAKRGQPEKLVLPEEKPAAFLEISDRCYAFHGTWPNPEQLTRFAPHCEKDL